MIILQPSFAQSSYQLPFSTNAEQFDEDAASLWPLT
jgi:hypothetical protein